MTGSVYGTDQWVVGALYGGSTTTTSVYEDPSSSTPVTLDLTPVATTETVTASPASAPADGASASTVTATVYDQADNPMADTAVTFSTNLGTLSVTHAVYTNSSGVVTDTLTSSTAGSATVTASVYGTSVSGTAPVTFFAPLTITTTSLPDGTLGQTYPSTTIQVTGGVPGTYCLCYQNWQATGLPTGLTLDPGSGILMGSPTQTGIFTVRLSVQDFATPTPNTATATMTLTVNAAVTHVSVAVSPDATSATNAQYTVGFKATSGLTVGQAVYLTGPAGTIWPSLAGEYVLNGSVASAVYGGGTDTVQVIAPVAITDGSTVTAAVYNATNPSIGGSYTLSVSTSADTTAVSSPSYTILAPLTITTTSLPDGTLGQTYPSTTIQVTGGVPGTYCQCYQNWQATGLPNGLTLDPGSGILMGSPTQTGIFTVRLSVQDFATPTPNTATAALTLTVNAAVTHVSVAVSPDATSATNAQYTVGFNDTSGLTVGQAVYLTGPAGTIWPSLAGEYVLNGSVASAVYGGGTDTVQVIAPVAITAGSTVTAAVYNATNPSIGGSYTLSVSTSADTTAVSSPSYTILAPLTITTTSLPDGTLGQTYPSTTIQVTGGVPGTYCQCYQNWQATGLPTGLTLDPGSGILMGSPTQTGIFTVGLSVQDFATPTPNTATATLTLTVNAAVTQPSAPVLSTISPTSAPVGTQITFTGSGFGSAPGSVDFYATSGSSTMPVVVSGTSANWSDTQVQVTVPSNLTVGTWSATVQNAATSMSSNGLNFTVTAPTTPLAITTGSLPAGGVNLPYSFSLTASGGAAPYTWSVVSGSLPSGIQLSSAGVLSGDPTTAGTASFTVQVTDSAGTTAKAAFTLEVTAAAPVPVPTSVPPPSVVTGQVVARAVPSTVPVGSVVLIQSVVGSATGAASGVTVTFTTSGGQLSSATAVTNGAGVASVFLTDLSAETDTVTAATSTASSTTQATFRALPAPPAPAPAQIVESNLQAISPTLSQTVNATQSGTFAVLAAPTNAPDSALSLTIGGVDPSQVVNSVTAMVYDSASAQGLLTNDDNVQIASQDNAGISSAVFLGPVVSFSTTNSTLDTSIFNDSNGTAQEGLLVTIPFDVAALPTGSTPELVWLDSSKTPPVWTNKGIVILSVNAQAGTITALLPHLSLYTVVGTVLTAPSISGYVPGGSSSSGSSASSGPSSLVGSAGGTLATADGNFSMTVPAGGVSYGSTLSVSESTAAPGNVPAGTTAASSVFAVVGPSLAQPLTATLKYSVSALGGLSANRVSVYARNADGSWTFRPTAAGSAAGTVQVSVTGPEVLVVLANTQQFPDLATGYWARSSIDTMLGASVINGFPDGTFQPDATLTRAQFVKMLALVLGLAPGSGSTAFSDVAAGSWYAPYVSVAVQAGLVDGLTSTTFGPDQTVTREQMAVLLTRALQLTGTTASSFSDSSQIDAWAASAVAAADAAGYLNGFPNGSFQPAGGTTRAQAAKVLALAIQHKAP